MAVGRPRGKRKSGRKAAARGVLHDDSRMVPDRDVVGIGTPQAPSSYLKPQALVQVEQAPTWSLGKPNRSTLGSTLGSMLRSTRRGRGDGGVATGPGTA